MVHTPEAHPTNDSALDGRISILLRAGMMIAATVILTGGVLFLSIHGRTTPDYRTFRGVPDQLNSVHYILRGALHGQSLAIIQLGMLLLIATPVLRVLFSVFAFAAARDYLYVAISTTVLVILFYSLIWH